MITSILNEFYEKTSNINRDGILEGLESSIQSKKPKVII